jgi:hypothetical protein
MRRLSPFLFISLCLMSVFFIVACAPGENQPTIQSAEASPAVEVASAQDVLISNNSTVPESNPTSNLVAEPVTANQDNQGCLDCHSNAELLEQLAEEEDVPEVPSEGSG